MNLDLQPCTIENLEVLRDLSIKTFFETFASRNTPENMEAYLEQAFHIDKLRGELSDMNTSFYFLYSARKLAGYLKLNEAPSQTEINDKCSLEIERIYVAKEFQGRGLGRYLMDQTVETAVQRGKRYVWLGVWEKMKRQSGFTAEMGSIR